LQQEAKDGQPIVFIATGFHGNRFAPAGRGGTLDENSELRAILYYSKPPKATDIESTSRTQLCPIVRIIARLSRRKQYPDVGLNTRVQTMALLTMLRRFGC
jgi:hypothetical protein